MNDKEIKEVNLKELQEIYKNKDKDSILIIEFPENLPMNDKEGENNE